MSSRPSRGAARLAAILDALPDGLLLVNCNGTVVNANTIALETFETPGTALVGRGLLDLLPDFDSRLIPGSMRRPAHADAQGRTKPTRMTARRTDGTEFPVEVTSANLEDGRDAFSADRPTGSTSLTGDELLMLVVRDLSGTVDTEAELARSQRQTEMILRAASEGVVGTDTDGRIVLANPAAAQILGFRASDLGGKELHTLAVHSRADGTPFPYEESPLADTLKSGRKHRVRGQVLWAKNGKAVPVDLTTAPVRDGEQLVGAVMTFTDRRAYDELVAQHAEELAATRERYDAEVAFGQERYEELAGRHAQLSAVLGGSLRGPLEELRGELGTLASDPAGQLWPEANQVLHHLAAGYARMTTLVDNVLGFQRLASGAEPLVKTNVLVDGIIGAAVEGAVELIGPGRAQFAVHAPAIEAEVDGGRLATALAHLVADVAGVDSTGKAPAAAAAGGYVDSTIVVAAALRGEVVRFEVRGPYEGGDPVHAPIVRGIVDAHGGMLQTIEVPGMSGSAYVLEVPLGAGSGVVEAAAADGVSAAARPASNRDPRTGGPAGAGTSSASPTGTGAASAEGGEPAAPSVQQGGGRRGRRASTDAFLDAGLPGGTAGAGSAPGSGPGSMPTDAAQPSQAAQSSQAAQAAQAAPSGRRRARRGPGDEQQELIPAQGTGEGSGGAGGGGTGRRRGRPSPAEGPGTGGDATHGAAGHEGPGGSDGAAVSPDAPGAGRAPGAGGLPGGQELALAGPARSSGGPAGVPVGVPRDPSAEVLRNPSEGSVVTAGEGAVERAALGAPVPPQGVPQGTPQGPPQARAHGVPPQGPPPADETQPPSGRRARRTGGPMPALPPAPSPHEAPASRPQSVAGTGSGDTGASGTGVEDGYGSAQGAGHPRNGADARTGSVPAPAPHDRRPPGSDASAMPGGIGGTPAGGVEQPDQDTPDPGAPGVSAQDTSGSGQVLASAGAAQQQGQAYGPGTGQAQGQSQGTAGGRRARRALATAPAAEAESPRGPFALPPAEADRSMAAPPGDVPQDAHRQQQGPTASAAHNGWPTPSGQVANPVPAPQPLPLPQAQPHSEGQPQPLPAEATHSTQGRAFSVRTLGQGAPFAQHLTQQQNQTLGSGRRRKLATPSPDERPTAATPEGNARPHPQSSPQQGPVVPQQGTQAGPSPAGTAQPGAQQAGVRQGDPQTAQPTPPPHQQSHQHAHQQLIQTPTEGRAYAIDAPDEGSEGPEPLDGPNGAVEVANRPVPRPVDDELPPEPLDNPRRLLVWPAPDVSTEQALSDRGYRPVIVHSREEVDAQIAAFPAALFVDPLTGPITRTALQSLRQAAVAAEVPVLVTAGLGQATREAAYGADPAVLLKALAPRDSEQHPPRVLLIEEHEEIAFALTATLERRGMQVARASDDTEAVHLASQMRPNLVVMDLMLVRRRRAGIVDWLRANGQLNRTPLVVYTSAGLDQSQLPRLSSGETVLFLAERSTSAEVQGRIVDLLAKIGTN
ncbi:PAS domain-containing protein [Streptomyces sp. CA-294286]|uniref:PAS domain-containing protein n=1 Tax=Streptomyces sp. CA-294286 TaxID=3240070 RepID=UPI003D92A5C2